MRLRVAKRRKRAWRESSSRNWWSRCTTFSSSGNCQSAKHPKHQSKSKSKSKSKFQSKFQSKKRNQFIINKRLSSKNTQIIPAMIITSEKATTTTTTTTTTTKIGIINQGKAPISPNPTRKGMNRVERAVDRCCHLHDVPVLLFVPSYCCDVNIVIGSVAVKTMEN